MPERIELSVLINLDPMPGAFHTPEQARQTIEATLLTRLGHYEPIVLLNK